MLKEIKKELLNSPGRLKNLLEIFDFHNIVIHRTYISFGRAVDSSKKSIVIRLEHNDFLYCTDYARNINKDLFAYIGEQKKIEFSEILNTVKSALGISDFCSFERGGIFGGFYDKIRNKTLYEAKTYDKSILDVYASCGNTRFLRDNISLETQVFFNIRYDIASQGIVIPIYNQIGQIMGVKVRCNYDVEDGEPKYYYLVPCLCSKTLYGYSQNYNYLVDNTVLVFESEKSVMQCHTYGIRNCVALGSGSVSSKQVQMLLELNPKKIILMHDYGYEKEYIDRNIAMIKNFSRFSEVGVGYWDWTQCKFDDKVSPSDLGKKELQRIIQTEVKMIGDEDYEEDL